MTSRSFALRLWASTRRRSNSSIRRCRAFAEFLLYEQDLYDFYEAYEWNPSPPLEELVENPPPTAPAAATQTVVQVLEDQCGVVVVTE